MTHQTFSPWKVTVTQATSDFDSRLHMHLKQSLHILRLSTGCFNEYSAVCKTLFISHWTRFRVTIYFIFWWCLHDTGCQNQTQEAQCHSGYYLVPPKCEFEQFYPPRVTDLSNLLKLIFFKNIHSSFIDKTCWWSHVWWEECD